MTGPYRTPMALARDPWTAAFFVLCAPFLIEFGVYSIGLALFPDMQPLAGVPLSRAYVGFATMVLCFGAAIRFGLISLWSDHIGAGPFTGAMRTNAKWIWIALIAGPVILLLPAQLADMMMQGQEGWIYSGDYDPAWDAPANRTLAKLAFVLVLAPIAEEVTFRGVAMGAMLSRGINPLVASVLASAAFAFTHLQYSPLAMAVVFVAGLGFSALRLASGTMVVPILAHMSANTVGTLLSY